MPNPKLPVIPESPPREYWRLLEPSTEDNPGETIRLGDEFSYTTPVRWDHVPVLWIGKKAGNVAIIRRRVAPPPKLPMATMCRCPATHPRASIRGAESECNSCEHQRGAESHVPYCATPTEPWYVPESEPKRPLQWRPLSELTGESRYILVVHKDYHASRIRYNSRGRSSIQELCFRQEGYEPTHFCELPEFEG